MGEPANVVEEMELEEAMTEGEAGGPTRRNVWTDPYDGLPVPDMFSGGSSATQAKYLPSSMRSGIHIGGNQRSRLQGFEGWHRRDTHFLIPACWLHS
jgi:hypothetical protein